MVDIDLFFVQTQFTDSKQARNPLNAALQTCKHCHSRPCLVSGQDCAREMELLDVLSLQKEVQHVLTNQAENMDYTLRTLINVKKCSDSACNNLQ